MSDHFDIKTEAAIFILTFITVAVILWLVFNPGELTLIWVSILLSIINALSRVIAKKLFVH
jgi:hypothetical protein